MQTITKDDFLSMVRLQHLEVLTSDQLKQNTEIIKGYMEKALTSELSEIEKADSNAMIAEVGELQQWCVLRNDFSKAVVYTRREQIAWDEPERGEFGEILKARGGTYKLTAENKKLGRVGQKYGEAKKESEERKQSFHRTALMTQPRQENMEGGEKKGKISQAERDQLFKLVNYSAKPTTEDDIDDTEITPEIKKIVDKLPSEDYSAVFNDLLAQDRDAIIPKKLQGGVFIATVSNGLGGETFKYLVDTQGYDYPRYVTRLVKEITPVE